MNQYDAVARVDQDFPLGHVKVHLARRHPDGGADVARFDATEIVHVGPTEAVADVGPDARPLVMPADMARALYEALAAHYGDRPADVRRLREALEDERRRVDRLIDRVIELGRPAS